MYEPIILGRFLMGGTHTVEEARSDVRGMLLGEGFSPCFAISLIGKWLND